MTTVLSPRLPLTEYLVEPRLPERAPEPPPAAPRHRTWAPGVVHSFTLVAGYVGLLALLRGWWFQADDFAFLAERVGPHARAGIWLPHNEHWTTGPIVAWRALYAVFGMTSSLPYLAVSLAAHVFAAHVLWRLMRRVGVGDWIATGLATCFVVLGAGHENLTWAFQLSFLGSLGLGLLVLLLLVRGDRLSFLAAVPVALAALTFSGNSLVLVGTAVLYLLSTRRRHEAVLLAAVCGSVYAAWYAVFGHLAPPSAHTATGAERTAAVSSWAWQALTLAFEALFSAPGAGWLLILGLGLGVARHLRARVASQGSLPAPVVGVVVALAGALVVQVVTLATARSDVGGPGTSRYVYIVVALSLPLIGLALTGPWPRAGRGVVAALVVYLIFSQGAELVASTQDGDGNAALRKDTLALAALSASGEQMFPTALAAHLDLASINNWVTDGVLGDLGGVPATALSDARALAQVRVTDVQPVDAEPAAVVAAKQDTLPGGCVVTRTRPVELAATVELTPSTTVAVTSDEAGEVAYQVAVPGSPASRLITVPLTRNQTYWVTVAAPVTVNLVALEGQPLTLCGA